MQYYCMKIFSTFDNIMRWIATILLIYIAALFSVPCSDASNSCKTSNNSSQEAQHSHDEDRDDYCAPFCQCSCCGITITTFKFDLPQFVIPIQEFKVKKIIIGNYFVVSSFSGSIWQPPEFNA